MSEMMLITRTVICQGNFGRMGRECVTRSSEKQKLNWIKNGRDLLEESSVKDEERRYEREQGDSSVWPQDHVNTSTYFCQCGSPKRTQFLNESNQSCESVIS